MKKSDAVKRLNAFILEAHPNALGVIEFLERELNFKPVRYISNGCLCGHFDTCSCSPSLYLADWEKE